MLKSLFFTFVYEPLYNGLVYFVDIIPGHDIGIAIILLTILVKVILFPLSRQAIKTQIAMRQIAPEVEAIKQKLKDNQEEQARAIFALYRERNIRPFASFFLILIQFPILFGLYWVFWKGGLPAVDTSILYTFVPPPESVNMRFLNVFDMGERSVILAAFAGLTQLAYARLSMGPRKPREKTDSPSFSSDMAHSFDLQARYVLPVIVAGIAYTVSAAVPLYWTTSNLFMIGQELLMGRRFTESKPAAPASNGAVSA
ncbi:MAG TPA: YidC/Oxa1 family membrane protein insertase [Candidatus Paceibacterota bacterium]|nr:YidC/Oxa1 family membrane protein insertase [Candidatus Paceibacterota bacterium]